MDVDVSSDQVIVAGVDEAGRGPLAGPVIAAAVVLDKHHPICGLTDSKLLSERKRESLFGVIKDRAMAWGIGHADVDEIDTLNILQATLLAMQRAVAALTIKPTKVLVDGNQRPKVACECEAIVGGDKIVPAISAASILAKVTRDAQMVELDYKYPGYGFAQHKGYPTRAHLAALQRNGVTAVHRKSYAPVRRLMMQELTEDLG